MPLGAHTYVDTQEQGRTYAHNANPVRHSGTPQPRQTNGTAEKPVDRRREAESLKLPVKQLSLKHEPGSAAGHSIAGLAGDVAGMQRPLSARKARVPRLDDTESIHSTTASEASHSQHQHVAYGRGYKQYPPGQLRESNEPYYSKPHGQPVTDARTALNQWAGNNWRSEVEDERRFHGIVPQQQDQQYFGEQVVEEEYDEEAFDDQGEEDNNVDQQLVVRTPSRVPSPRPVPAPVQKAVVPIRATTVVPEQLPAPKADVKHSTRSSSIGSTDEEVQQPLPIPPSQSLKRVHDNVISLDYDPSTFRTMTYADFEKDAFTTDPRAEPLKPVVDAHGVPLSLAGKLANMPRMQEADIKAMFEVQTDVEREETGGWFVEQMTEMMKRVVRVRVERRKTALEFEMEVKRRQKLVELKDEEVKEELRGLEKGGRALIGKRTSEASSEISVGMSTPVRKGIGKS